MKFKCSHCEYLSNDKLSMTRHINRKVKCTSEIPEIIELLVVFECNHCKKNFTLEKNLKRHLNVCKIKKIDLEKELAIKEEKVKELENRLAISEALNKKPSNVNIAQQNILNINLTAYNDPNLKGMEKYYLEAIKKAFLSVPYLIEKIHFNVSYPENQSMVIKNNRTKIAKVYDGTKWTSKDESELIDEIINTYEQLLEDYAEDDPEHMKHIERYRNIKERDTEENVLRDLKEEIKKLMYDNRTMVKIK
jgi:hypothetical protein